MEKNCGNSGCPCRKMPGIVIALIGISFLLNHAGVTSEALQAWVWPGLLTALGLVKVAGTCCKCQNPGT